MYRADDFYVFQHLNRPRTMAGFEYDEFIPALVIGVVAFFVLQSPILSVCLFFGWAVTLKMLKRGQGRGYLMTLLYWHLPYSIGKYFFSKSPNSDDKIYHY